MNTSRQWAMMLAIGVTLCRTNLIWAKSNNAQPIIVKSESRNGLKPETPLPSDVRKWMATLPPPVKIQAAAFDYLAQKCGQRLQAPHYPRDRLLQWNYAQFAVVRDGEVVAIEDPKVLYPAIYRSLLIARDLLQSSDVRQRRRGMVLVDAVGTHASATLRDANLTVQIKNGWLLPFLADAYEDDTRALSRYNVLREAAGAYKQNGETARYGAALQALEVLAESYYARDSKLWANGADWVHIKLGEFYQNEKRYAEAIAQFKAIRTPSMSAAKVLIPELELLARDGAQAPAK